MKIKVLIVDDSALIRSVMREIIGSQPDMEVVGVAPDPIIARELIKQTNPDVLTLDVEMPRMDGLDFLEKLMRLRPMPVVMVSSLTERGSEITLRALELGAIDFVTKPKISIQSGMQEYADMIADKIRAASKARVKARAPRAAEQGHVPGEALPQIRNPLTSSEKLIIIGASTGGTEAIKEFLIRMPSDCPGILITQHMPEGFTRSFAQRLNNLCKISVTESAGNERVLPGHAYIAPGHSHLKLVRSGANYMTQLDQGPPVNRHRPSVDVLFQSAAACAGKNAVGVILTGMGKDGAQGMLEMKGAGAYNFAQDEASCVVFGMPREAIAIGAAHEVLSLQAMPGRVLAWLAEHGSRALRV
ncbi:MULTISPECIES: chemotaxis response regulator protein-glutamate methylesterase [unclassified Herbaspirillum]|uniref:protein-glutamate methylesterase/protein-glutamine glutaminase n=1 Tax=unclassified Herbaspirillum TaxID=2624150 RepID=UPI001153B848|nr:MULTISPECIES: chemotaxis response regulator protein-glutamate methylesterase [unclassified Herbaspirillum]MBB5392896.1 two-component system chemotaxis response regulator CheB [Herbaspirillum sp. SJZ102]TQK04458.1 two-component system chemotaxis response regulator CheB [Herbaspirillum sp. SJZ130]TQK09757.1 two-component system chemotaxis response regulator CheB [Herbaspirillum sp. SJZ106]TWC65893.1 two-component system chemotaxis response regulator CheB [Herbaspirillum sp. SJZ099]